MAMHSRSDPPRELEKSNPLAVIFAINWRYLRVPTLKCILISRSLEKAPISGRIHQPHLCHQSSCDDPFGKGHEFEQSPETGISIRNLGLTVRICVPSSSRLETRKSCDSGNTYIYFKYGVGGSTRRAWRSASLR